MQRKNQWNDKLQLWNDVRYITGIQPELNQKTQTTTLVYMLFVFGHKQRALNKCIWAPNKSLNLKS